MSKSRVIGKYFRLIDFHVYDSNPKESISDSSSESSNGFIQCNDFRFTIQMFGLNESGETCCLYINDYKPFFYIKVGDDWSNGKAQELLKQHEEMQFVPLFIDPKIKSPHEVKGHIDNLYPKELYPK